jgi:predicted ATPase
VADKNIFLKQVNLHNFLSLHEVSLPFKPLTVLVGNNASGKSNILKACLVLNRLIQRRDTLPDSNTIQDWTWVGEPNGQINFEIQLEIDNKPAIYHLVLQNHLTKPICTEKLLINDVEVISVHEGKGQIRTDENKESPILTYSSSKLALTSAGDYGNKPVTNLLTDFIKNWAFFNFMPEMMRRKNVLVVNPILDNIPTQLDSDGSVLKHLLFSWYENNADKFEAVSQALASSVTQFRLESLNEEGELGLLEGYEKPIPLDSASDGTLRLLAYYTLLNQSELPSLIAIEEPERNLHPAALVEVANLLDALAMRTQVIVTTHSAQFLDAFEKDSLGNRLGVLLLQNQKGYGTKIIDFEEEQNTRTALSGWVKDFGIGSAIFESELL